MISLKNFPASHTISEFCVKWRIRELSLFGSVIRNDFSPVSDVDVLVSFDKSVNWDLFKILEMREELESLFGRKVDIAEKEAIRNPFRRHEILTHREVLFAA